VTLEANAHYAEVAEANIAQAGFADRVEFRVGPALDTLPHLAAEDAGPFDLVFIDADKRSNPEYLRWALDLSRPGSLIVADNVVRGGAVRPLSALRSRSRLGNEGGRPGGSRPVVRRRRPEPPRVRLVFRGESEVVPNHLGFSPDTGRNPRWLGPPAAPVCAAPASHPTVRLPQSPLRMGSELDSATPRTSAALSGYGYAYRYAWRFS
jgi:hypothetical protein